MGEESVVERERGRDYRTEGERGEILYERGIRNNNKFTNIQLTKSYAFISEI